MAIVAVSTINFQSTVKCFEDRNYNAYIEEKLCRNHILQVECCQLYKIKMKNGTITTC